MSKLAPRIAPISGLCDLPPFGQLEFKVMKVLWQREEAGKSTTTVQDCVDNIRTRGKPPAYTTITTVVYRLRKKGWLERVKRAERIIYYRTTRSRHEVGRELLQWVVADFFDNDPAKHVLVDERSDDERKLAIVAE